MIVLMYETLMAAIASCTNSCIGLHPFFYGRQ